MRYPHSFLPSFVIVCLTTVCSGPSAWAHGTTLEFGDTKNFGANFGVDITPGHDVEYLIGLQTQGFKGKPGSIPCLLSKGMAKDCNDVRFFMVGASLNLSKEGVGGFNIEIAPVVEAKINEQIGLQLKTLPMTLSRDVDMGNDFSLKISAFELSAMKMWGTGYHPEGEEPDFKKKSDTCEHHCPVEEKPSKVTAMVHAAIDMIGYRYMNMKMTMNSPSTPSVMPMSDMPGMPGMTATNGEATSTEMKPIFSGFGVIGAMVGGSVKWNMSEKFALQFSLEAMAAESVNANGGNLIDFHGRGRFELLIQDLIEKKLDLSVYLEGGYHGHVTLNTEMDTLMGHEYLVIGLGTKF